jgi:hypothetical protein
MLVKFNFMSKNILYNPTKITAIDSDQDPDPQILSPGSGSGLPRLLKFNHKFVFKILGKVGNLLTCVSCLAMSWNIASTPSPVLQLVL